MRDFTEIRIYEDIDGTSKFVFKNNLGWVEIASVKSRAEKEYNTMCVPSHYYCNLGCSICHLTDNTKTRKMLPISKSELVYTINATSELIDNKKDNLLISFMGVGEPSLNLKLIEGVWEDRNLLDYNKIELAISTMYPNKASIIKLTKALKKGNIPTKLHFSMHSPIEEDRKSIIPSSKCDLFTCMKQLNQFDCEGMDINFHRTSNKSEIHYTLIKGVNDSDIYLKKLIDYLRAFPIQVKLITFNQVSDMTRAQEDVYKKWVREIGKITNCFIYLPPGQNIGSSCGQFTKYFYLKETMNKKELIDFKKFEEMYLKRIIKL